jgi:hypothetical protein
MCDHAEVTVSYVSYLYNVSLTRVVREWDEGKKMERRCAVCAHKTHNERGLLVVPRAWAERVNWDKRK